METQQSAAGLSVDRDGHLYQGHHCCFMTAGEGTHELCLPKAPSEQEV